MPDVLYFGCMGRAGHFLFDHDGQRPYGSTPWGYDLDGGLLDSSKPEVEGVVQFHQKDGWTAIAFWDRSVDSRYASNSAFLVAESVSAETLLAMARESWPAVFSRCKFRVALPEDN